MPYSTDHLKVRFGDNPTLYTPAYFFLEDNACYSLCLFRLSESNVDTTGCLQVYLKEHMLFLADSKRVLEGGLFIGTRSHHLVGIRGVELSQIASEHLQMSKALE